MADTPTLLSYQVTYEVKVFDLMTNSQQMNDYGMACMYGEALLDFLGNDIPQKPIADKEKDKKIEIVMYYELLFKTIMRKIRVNIDAIRSFYGKEVEIPTIIQEKRAS